MKNFNTRSYYRKGSAAIQSKPWGLIVVNALHLFNFFEDTCCIKRTRESCYVHVQTIRYHRSYIVGGRIISMKCGGAENSIAHLFKAREHEIQYTPRSVQLQNIPSRTFPL